MTHSESIALGAFSLVMLVHLAIDTASSAPYVAITFAFFAGTVVVPLLSDVFATREVP